MYCTAPLSPCKGRLRSFRDDDDDDGGSLIDQLQTLSHESVISDSWVWSQAIDV